MSILRCSWCQRGRAITAASRAKIDGWTRGSSGVLRQWMQQDLGTPN